MLFPARILQTVPRRVHSYLPRGAPTPGPTTALERSYSYMPTLAPLCGLLFRAYGTYPDYTFRSEDGKPYPDAAPRSATIIPPPPRDQPNHAAAKPAEPTAVPDGADYWNDMSPAIPHGGHTYTAPAPASGPTGLVDTLEIHCAPGVKLEGHRRQIVGAVLDLMQGKVTLQKMSRRFWAEDAVYEDNMNKAVGIDEVDAQWVSAHPSPRLKPC